MDSYNQIRCNQQAKYHIFYHECVDIDGFACRKEFSNLIASTGRKYYSRAHEWCCGHGAIGFQLLEDKLCHHLVLTDKFELATQDCRYSVAANDLFDAVTVYTTDRLDTLPVTEKWDLFVANLPWRSRILPGPELGNDQLRKMFDLDWQLHDHMWSTIDQYLTQGADVYLYEDHRFSNVDTWQDGIKRAGLVIKDVITPFGAVATGYVMHLKKE